MTGKMADSWGAYPGTERILVVICTYGAHTIADLDVFLCTSK